MKSRTITTDLEIYNQKSSNHNIPFNNMILRSKFSLFLLAVCAALQACSSVGLGVINTKEKINKKHQSLQNIVYGEKTWQKLDVYTPVSNQTNLKPVIVFFYGGSWDSGRKEQYLFAASAFTQLGYVVVIPDYVKFPQGKFPQFIHDGAASIAWVKKHISEHGGNPDQVFIVGHSAGAHLGALLVTDAEYLSKHDLKPTDVSAFAGLAGPYNFTPKAPKIVRIFEPEENYPKMKIMNHLNGDEPPMLFAHGLKDTTVSVRNQQANIKVIQQIGGTYKEIVYPEASHVSILLRLSSFYRGGKKPSEDIHNFFRSVSN